MKTKKPGMHPAPGNSFFDKASNNKSGLLAIDENRKKFESFIRLLEI
jgi:hypothetical protein